MARERHERSLVSGLRLVLNLAGARPLSWVLSIIAVSILLSMLDAVGVAAMIPLTQLISGASPDSGALQVISSIVGSEDPRVLIPVVAIGIAAIFIVKSILALIFRWWLLGRTNRVSALASSELLERYLLSPYAVHRTRQMSEIYRNINQTTGQSASALTATVGIITDLMLLAAITAILLYTAPLVTGIAVAIFAGLVLGVQRLLRARQSRIGEEMAEAGLQAWAFMIPGLNGFREARLASSAEVFVEGFRRAKMRGAHAGQQMGIVSEAPRYALEIGFVLAVGGMSIVLFMTGTTADALTVLGVFAAASLRGVPTLYRVAGSLATVRANRVSLRILATTLEELDGAPRHDERPSGIRYEGDITIQGVSFHYPDSDQLVLDDVSLIIPAKQTTAFVGSSGAGKSTLMDLVLGLLEPTSGTIECGGRSILDDRAAWYAGLGVVPQDVFLTNDTVAANIAFGVAADGVDRDRVREVIRIARLDELVASLPEGIETQVGERGVRLSGGQRQRLGLARALYARPSVLVLDEATSALDNVTEHEITETLAGLSGSLTVIIVAHRLSTVRDADTLVFLKDGHVDAQGTFASVRQTSADFARLVQLGDLG
jgi:ABC-type bacteriocin/lantibiotic exporter with double-glycine peptidase domain